MNTAVIVDAVRTPIGRFGGGLLESKAADLAEHVIRSIVERNGISGDQVDEVILGQVLQGGSGANVARTALVRAGLPVTVTGSTINMVCASGMRAVDMARQSIMLGEGKLHIAGGVESMSNAAFYTTDMRWGHKLGSVKLLDSVMDEGLSCSLSGLGMGMTAEEIASRNVISREDMDAFAVESQNRALAAVEAGRFTDEIVPMTQRKGDIVNTDEQPRVTDLEALAKLRPAFKPDGCVTAGNSSTINDGAVAMLVADENWAKAEGLRSRAKIVGSAASGVEPEVMGLGPVEAVRKLCSRMGVSVEDFELVELNEAFAVQALAVIRELKLDHSRVNVNGGAVALGHPLGASGARILTSLLHEMEKRQLGLGLATLCVGGGMGMAMAIERA